MGFKLALAKAIGQQACENIKNSTQRKMEDGYSFLKNVHDKEYAEATMVAGRHIGRTALGTACLVGTAGALLAKTAVNKYKGNPLLDEKNRGRLIMVGGAILTMAIISDVGDMLDSASDMDLDALPGGDINSLDCVNHGMLIDSSQLGQIIDMGEVDGAEHIPEANIVRSEVPKMEFLHENGYSYIPPGYEIHHIVPLSEGGPDSPDNMILLSHEDHAKVTAAHSAFYGWHNHDLNYGPYGSTYNQEALYEQYRI